MLNISADNCHGEQPGDEAPADGPGRVDALVRLPLHRPLLRGHVQGGRRLDLHGGHGRQPGQVLLQGLQVGGPRAAAAAAATSGGGEVYGIVAQDAQDFFIFDPILIF